MVLSSPVLVVSHTLWSSKHGASLIKMVGPYCTDIDCGGTLAHTQNWWPAMQAQFQDLPNVEVAFPATSTAKFHC